MSRILSAITLSVIFSLAASSAHAVNHDVAAREQDPGIDWIITGANRAVQGPVNPPVGANQADCPLCYHRLLLEQDGGGGVQQPYPGE